MKLPTFAGAAAAALLTVALGAPMANAADTRTTSPANPAAASDCWWSHHYDGYWHHTAKMLCDHDYAYDSPGYYDNGDGYYYNDHGHYHGDHYRAHDYAADNAGTSDNTTRGATDHGRVTNNTDRGTSPAERGTGTTDRGTTDRGTTNTGTTPNGSTAGSNTGGSASGGPRR
jgi:hypothetical protein